MNLHSLPCLQKRKRLETLTSNKKLLLSKNAPETPEALNFLKELVEKGKLKVVLIGPTRLKRWWKLIGMWRKGTRKETSS